MPTWNQVYYTAGAKNDFTGSVGEVVDLWKILNDIGEELLVRHADYNFNGKNLTNLGSIAQDAWVVVGSGGSAPAFQNSWVNWGTSYVPARFRKTKHGTVRVEMMVRAGTPGDASGVVFTLPTGYRPPYALLVPAAAPGVIGVVEVRLDGTVVVVFGSTTWTSTAFEFSLT